MAELTRAEVYTPRSMQVWRALLNWLAFFFQIFAQIIRAVGQYPMLSSSSSSSSTGSSSTHRFKPLPVVDSTEIESPATVEIAAVLDSPVLADENRSEKLTIFAQIIRAVGQYPMLSSSSSSSSTGSSSTHRFKPLPVVDSTEIESPATVEIAAVLDSPVLADENRSEKLTVVLDLDETLVCAYETSSLPPALRNQATDAGLKWFELECVASDKECEGKPKINYVTVFERPGLQEFLNQLSEFAELVLFTAGLEGYARPLVDRIDAENRFSLRLYRPSTICTDFREHVKDLSCLSRDLCRTVIVDNNPFSFLLQPLNGIPCIPFSAGQPHDTQLLDVLLPLLKHLSQQKDVRPVLYDRFHMLEWFEKQGIPASSWSV